MSAWLGVAISLVFGLAGGAGWAGEAPAQLEDTELRGLAEIDPNRRALVSLALAEGRQLRLVQYIFGSADPGRGGFDCSGAMYHVLRKAGLEPPRSSGAQYDWIKKAGGLVEVPAGTRSLDDAVFDKLRPGDLLFWSGTYQPTDGRTNGVTHVQMYLGREKKDGRRVMIGSSDGRGYRGKRQCGFGVFDFKLPSAKSKARLVGFGPPPGLEPSK